eukprot:gene10389-21668_t
MVQGNIKLSKSNANKVNNSAKSKKAEAKSKTVQKGNPRQLPKSLFRNEALDDRDLSKAINKSSEQKVAAKLIQGGGALRTSDIRQSGKELNREHRRSVVKRKLTRIEEKLKDLQAKSDKEDRS